MTRDLTLAGIRAAYASRLTPKELMGEIRESAATLTAHNAFIHILSDSEQAPWLNALNDKDPETCPLWGVPFVIKDNIDLAGIPTTAACVAFTYTPDSSAFVVQQLLDAGAIPVGKTNLDQFATGLNGTRSPWGPCGNSIDPAFISGGSSAGSAVAVALCLACFGLGTDTAGSGRVPAGFNNLIGVKPTRGLLSTSGVVPACRSLDCVSIFALHTDDADHILSVAEGHDPQDAYSRENSVINNSRYYGHYDGALTLGIIPQSQLQFFGDAHYEACYGETLDRLREQGIDLVDIDYEPFDEIARLLYEGPWVTERYIATLPLIKEDPDAFHPAVREIIAAGEQPTAVDLFTAQYRLRELDGRCRSQLSQVDALLTPTAGRLFTIEELRQEPIKRNSELGYYMNFVNLLDLAAVAVPSAWTRSGQPFGITLSAEAFSDRRLLSIANRLQQSFQLSLGATGIALPALSSQPAARADWQEILVCGAHMQGMPLNSQLTERGGRFVESVETSAEYRLYALNESPLQRPALIRSSAGESGQSITAELWRLPTEELGSFLTGIAAPLGLGQVKLKDGRSRCGFIAEACAIDNATDVTEFKGWRAYLRSRGD